MSTETDKLPPPPINSDITIKAPDGRFQRFDPAWINWFNSLQVKTVTIGPDLVALSLLTGTGFSARIADGIWALRTHTGTVNRITVTNGDGVSGNPVYDISAAYVGQGSITTLGTITTGVWNGTTIAIANGGTGATDAAGARTNLGAFDVGANIFTAANPAAVTFIRINADNSVTFRTPAEVVTDLGISALTVQDEGVTLSAAVTAINFTGVGVTATNVGPVVTVNIPGGGGGASITAVSVTLPYGRQDDTVTVVDGTITATSKIVAGWGNCTDLDENGPDMDDVTFRAIPALGSFDLKVSSMRDSIGGVFKINYTASA